MQTITIAEKSRKVIATRNDKGWPWNARLYVNNGETATLQSAKFVTEKGLRRWAAKVLAR